MTPDPNIEPFAPPLNFKATRQKLGEKLFRQCLKKSGINGCTNQQELDAFEQILIQTVDENQLPEYCKELAAMETCIRFLAHNPDSLPRFTEHFKINPSLRLFSNKWRGLAGIIKGTPLEPQSGEENVMIWRHPENNGIRLRSSRPEDLLALKIAAEQLDTGLVAHSGGVQKADINGVLLNALNDGIITGPEPGIKRTGQSGNDTKTNAAPDMRPYMRARIFALQWHITQACDLHCRHCYDRTPTPHVSLSRGIKILDDFHQFCDTHHVFGQVTFTGGNPLMHPDFFALYRQAADRGFTTAILGNPALKNEMEAICEIQRPAFFQVSLEGLESHNDYIRGKGHFRRVLSFLKILGQLKIYSKVMLTLTRANLGQVTELGKFLQDRANLFTFNRLSLEGEGASLEMADPSTYPDFLKQYSKAAEKFSVMGFKDNLFNIHFLDEGSPFFGGCTGFGCGAAFNFVSILPSGKVHACRKFHSPIGDLTKDSLTDIYHSDLAKRYRLGPEACRSCEINPVCRGCLAASQSSGLDCFVNKDPFCFTHLNTEV